MGCLFMIPARLVFSVLLAVLVSLPGPLGIGKLFAQENSFPLLPGLEDAVEFWKLVFTRYGASEVIFHDPLEPTKVYKVLEVKEGNQSRRVIEDERKKIFEEHGFSAEERRVRVQRGVKERFTEGLRLSRRYLDQMQRIFQEEGLPPELAYLPLVESSFNLRARSRVGAVGIWQFMPRTGKQFLRITPHLDERRDPLESTRAAARFLKENYRLFGNWPLAITAYNHGREGVLRAVTEVGSNDLTEIIRRYEGPAFRFASKSFYAEFLAALEVARGSAEFFPNLEYHPPFPLEEVEIERPISVAALLKSADISRGDFLEWNPALAPKIRDLPRGYRAKVPPEKLELFLAAYQKAVGVSPTKPRPVLPAPAAHVSWIRHRVAPGETLSLIAKNYRTSVEEIQQANRLASAHLISAGQRLKIPKR
jgi:membrane-bound lytic murein transglycosylase D